METKQPQIMMRAKALTNVLFQLIKKFKNVFEMNVNFVLGFLLEGKMIPQTQNSN